MAVAVVFGFAVADGLRPVVGAAPYDVLARQLPRILVARLNGGGDRGVRFFPFLGLVDGQRNFLGVHELFEPTALAQLHRQGDVQLLCDGIFRDGALHWRVLDGRSLEVRVAGEVAFDPRQPIELLTRLEFELTGLLGWMGRPQQPYPLTGEALGWFLVLKDALLRREANLGDPSPDPLRPARRCVELAPGTEEVRQLVMDFAAHLLRRGESRPELAGMLATLANTEGAGVATIERLAVLLQAAGDDHAAASASAKAARAALQRTDLVERTAAMLFRLERFAEARELVELARDRGVASLPALAQLAAVCDRTGDRAGRARLTEELLAQPHLPVPVARLVVSFLIEEERAAAARDVANRALAHDPSHAMLHFELGRAHLLLDEGGAAAEAFRRALALGLPAAIETEARRFLRLAAVPGLWLGTQRVERELAGGDLAAALAEARALVRLAAHTGEVWYLVGVVRHKLGQSRRAEHALRRALRCDDGLADAHNRLGILLVSCGRLEQGHGHLVRAHELAPNESSPLLHLAQACALLGRLPEAERHVAAAERLGADPQMVQAVRREILSPRE